MEERYDIVGWLLSRVVSHPIRVYNRLSRHYGTKFICFFNEPQTGNTWWKLLVHTCIASMLAPLTHLSQGNLPKGVYPICLVLYANKTKLSTFGTAKAYPVYVWCANLPASLHNRKSLAGGWMVGLLPIVSCCWSSLKSQLLWALTLLISSLKSRAKPRKLSLSTSRGLCSTNALQSSWSP